MKIKKKALCFSSILAQVASSFPIFFVTFSFLKSSVNLAILGSQCYALSTSEQILVLPCFFFWFIPPRFLGGLIKIL